MSSYLTAVEKTSYDLALQGVFDTFARPFRLFVNAQQAVISTSFTYSRFGDHSQDSAIDADNTAVMPIYYTVTGCINYGNKQPWDYSNAPGAQQDKLRESFGTIRVKVDATGYALLKNAKMVTLDGFDFTLNSNARPHGLVGEPTRWTFTLQKCD